MKKLIHTTCSISRHENELDRRNHICAGCGKRPPGNEVQMVRSPNHATEEESAKRRRSVFDEPDFYFSPHNRRNRSDYGYPRV